jgi:hypothetical protein
MAAFFRMNLLRKRPAFYPSSLYMIIYAGKRRIEASRYAERYGAQYAEIRQQTPQQLCCILIFIMPIDPTDINADVLNSWKEVAVYLGRGVRTVQRWESDLGLPVRRPRGKSRSAIIALKPEIDRWLRGVPKEALSKEIIIKKPHGTAIQAQSLRNNTELLMSKTRQILERSFALCAQSQNLREQLNRAVSLTARFGIKNPAPATGTRSEQKNGQYAQAPPR